MGVYFRDLHYPCPLLGCEGNVQEKLVAITGKSHKLTYVCSTGEWGHIHKSWQPPIPQKKDDTC